MEPQESNEREAGGPDPDEGQILRFVVLRHEPGEASGDKSVHWDFLIETIAGAERLPTWRLAAWPGLTGSAFTVAAVRLPDHRRAYLDYEGEISGGRGRVIRVAAGKVTRLSGTSDRLEILLLTGEKVWRVNGRAENVDGWEWSFTG